MLKCDIDTKGIQQFNNEKRMNSETSNLERHPLKNVQNIVNRKRTSPEPCTSTPCRCRNKVRRSKRIASIAGVKNLSDTTISLDSTYDETCGQEIVRLDVANNSLRETRPLSTIATSDPCNPSSCSPSRIPPVVSLRGTDRRSWSNDDQNMMYDDAESQTFVHLKKSPLLEVYLESVSPKFSKCINIDRPCLSDITEENESADTDGSFIDVSEDAKYNLVIVPFADAMYSSGISPYDAQNKGNTLEVPEYVTDIFQRLYQAETQHAVKPYLHYQPRINGFMRSILVDWLLEVHIKFRLEQETIHLCVNILDRYLAAIQVERNELQLVGVTALLLASKYEEIYPPEIKDFVSITDHTFACQQILDMEVKILDALKYNISVPNAYPFLQRFLFLVHATESMKFASNYYLDRMLQEHEVLNFRPSLIAAAIVCLAVNHPDIRDHDEVHDPKPRMPKILLQYTGYSTSSILDAASFVASKVGTKVKSVSRRDLVVVRSKYGEACFNYISSDAFAPPVVGNIFA